MNRQVLFAWLLSLCAAACAESTPPEQVGGESNWLESCERDSDCAVGSCWCGVCTAACEDSDACAERGGGDCFDPTLPALAECRPERRLCLETCTDSEDCSKGQRCADGTCLGDTRPEDGDSGRDAAPDDDAPTDDDDGTTEPADDDIEDDDTAEDDDDVDPRPDDDNPGDDDVPSELLPLPACPLPPTSQIPLLSHDQYDRTVRDLLDVTALDDGSPPSALLAPEHVGELATEDWTAYQNAAVAIAARALSTESRSNFITCTPDQDAECLRRTVSEFGRRAFRRPLSEEEVAGFLAIAGESEETAAEADLEAILATFLISPSFLLRAEVSERVDADGAFVLSSHELAQRLSYMLWGSLPDEELDRVADSGQLDGAESLRAEAERMLADPRAAEIVAEFHRAYMQMDDGRWTSIVRDAAVFPEFTDDMALLMRLETERFFDDVVFEQEGSFADLFSSNVGFVTAATAPLYDLDASDFGEELTRVDYDAERRPGVFTRVGFLSAHAHADRSAPIRRGAFLLKNVLGTDVGPPDPAAASTPLPSDPELQTNRQRTEAVTAGVACVGCHASYIDPFGFALESYDALGRWQENDSGTGAPIDTEVDVTIDGVSVHVTGPSELMAAIAASEDARRQYAKQWLSHAYARNGFPVDDCTGPALGERLGREGYRVLDLIVDLTQSPAFRTRVLDTTE